MKKNTLILFGILVILLGLPIVNADTFYLDGSGNYISTQKLNFLQSMLIGGESQLITSSNPFYSLYGGSGWISKPVVTDSDIIFGETTKVVGFFRAAKEGDYMLEAGIEWAADINSNVLGTQLIVPITKNVCDPQDVHFVNKVVHLPAGDHRIEFTVKPNGPGERSPNPGPGFYVFQVAWLDYFTQGGVPVCRDSIDGRKSTSTSPIGYVRVKSATVTPLPTPPVEPPPVPPVITPLSGEFKSIKVNPEQITTSGQATITVEFMADVAGNYFLEGSIGRVSGAGALQKILQESQLTQTIDSNRCDVNPSKDPRYEFVNEVLELPKGKHTINFVVKPNSGSGVYRLGSAWLTSSTGEIDICKVPSDKRIVKEKIESGEFACDEIDTESACNLAKQTCFWSSQAKTCGYQLGLFGLDSLFPKPLKVFPIEGECPAELDAKVVLNVNPSTANILVSGDKFKSGETISLCKGNYVFDITSSGFRDYTLSLDLAAQEKLTTSIKMFSTKTRCELISPAPSLELRDKTGPTCDAHQGCASVVVKTEQKTSLKGTLFSSLPGCVAGGAVGFTLGPVGALGGCAVGGTLSGGVYSGIVSRLAPDEELICLDTGEVQRTSGFNLPGLEGLGLDKLGTIGFWILAVIMLIVGFVILITILKLISSLTK